MNFAQTVIKTPLDYNCNTSRFFPLCALQLLILAAIFFLGNCVNTFDYIISFMNLLY